MQQKPKVTTAALTAAVNRVNGVIVQKPAKKVRTVIVKLPGAKLGK